MNIPPKGAAPAKNSSAKRVTDRCLHRVCGHRIDEHGGVDTETDDRRQWCEAEGTDGCRCPGISAQDAKKWGLPLEEEDEELV